jgi:hypothetical protein
MPHGADAGARRRRSMPAAKPAQSARSARPARPAWTGSTRPPTAGPAAQAASAQPAGLPTARRPSRLRLSPPPLPLPLLAARRPLLAARRALRAAAIPQSRPRQSWSRFVERATCGWALAGRCAPGRGRGCLCGCKLRACHSSIVRAPFVVHPPCRR